jgi:asparagine synthase (glutamine-hydrolysing)
MCGVVGLLSTEKPVDLRVFEAMVDTLVSRGPDGRGVKVLEGGRLCLGHRRLSIIDLSDAGSQPMSNEVNSVWVVFNGEIYNYIDLRRQLERCGHVFCSQSDSETIIHAFEEWGTECVHHLRGIFAFAIYDCHNKSLFLARDHVGVKPLYYYKGNGAFVFASQPRSILAYEGYSKKIDPSAFSLFLAYGNVPGDSCIYAGINKLLPGHWLIYKDGKILLEKYWSVTYKSTIRDIREAEQAVRKKVEDCILTQTVSDVPIGTLLSGGIDSTIITSILSKDNGASLSSYTIGFDEGESDEREFALLAARAFHTNHHERVLTYSDACKSITDIVEAFDEPFHLNSLFPYFALSSLVKESSGKVVLGGDGADELFAGYLWYEHFINSQVPSRFRSFIKKLSSVFGLKARDQFSSVETFFRYNGPFDQYAQNMVIGSAVPPTTSDIYQPLMKHWRPDLPLVLAAQLLDFNCFLVDHCLTKVDRASMAFGVEVRVPFLDVELVELVFSIDHRITFCSGERKALLKRAMRHALPPDMNKSRKKGFSCPVVTWLESGIANEGEKMILGGSLCNRGLLDEVKLQARYSMLNSWQQLLLISAELWARLWLDGDKRSVQIFSERCNINYVNLN